VSSEGDHREYTGQPERALRAGLEAWHASNRRHRLSGSRRKAVLTLHIVAALGLLGASTVMVVAALHAATRDDPQDAHAVYDLLRLLTFALDIPLAIVTLLSGLTLALTSAWRIFGDRWLTTKLALYLATVTLGVAVLGPSIDTMLDVTETSSPGRARCGGSPSNCPPRRPRCCSQPQRSACSSPAEARAGGSRGHEGSRARE
jgi:uncharacterized membrane protein